jgi:hypothetical protein
MARALKKPFEIKRLVPAQADPAARRRKSEPRASADALPRVRLAEPLDAAASPAGSQPGPAQPSDSGTKKRKKQPAAQLQSLEQSLGGLGYRFGPGPDSSIGASRLELSEPELPGLPQPSAAASPERFARYFTKASEKKRRDRQMVRVEERIFCSDWDRATHLIDFEERKIRQLLQAAQKPLDDATRCSLFEALLHGEYCLDLAQLGGSLLEFGFAERLGRDLLTAKAFVLTLVDLAAGSCAALCCKPSVVQKSIFLADVAAPPDQDLEVHSLKEIVSHFVGPRTSMLAVLFHAGRGEQAPATQVPPGAGGRFAFCLRFVNIRSPISYSEPQVCAEVGGFLLALALAVDAYYPREVRLKTYPTVAIGGFVERLRARAPHVHLM